MKSDLIDITVQLHAATAHAIKVSTSGDVKKAVWLPLSQAVIERRSSGVVVVTMPEWLAVEKELV